MIEAIIGFFAALPELIKLFREMQKRIDEAGVDRKVAEDVKAVRQAFAAKDAGQLNAIFKAD